jgi:hypothetical protein
MSLEGNLSSFGLSEILQLIAVQQKSGMLSISRQSSSMKLFFREGKIISTRDRRRSGGDPLKDYLARYGILTLDELARLTELSTQSKLDITDVIVSERALGEAELKTHCRNHIQEAVHDVLTWEQCSYKFIAGMEVTNGVKPLAEVAVEGLLMESMRRIDEFPLILKELCDGRMTVKKRAGAAAKDLTASEKTVLSMLTGGRSIDYLVANARLPRFDTYEAIKSLKEKNLIELEAAPTPDRGAETDVVKKKRTRTRARKNAFPALAACAAFVACGIWGIRCVAPFFRLEPAAASENAGASRSSTARNRFEAQIRWNLEVYRAKNGNYPKDLSDLNGQDSVSESFSRRASEFSFRYYLTPEGDRYILL